MNNETIVIKSKDTYYNTGATIAIVTILAMSAMFALIVANSPMWLTLPVFLGLMFGLINLSTAYHTVTINGLELNRTIEAVHQKLPLKTKTERYEWSQVKWYKEGKDKGRYTNEFEFLKIGFNNGIVWTITDSKGANKAVFEQFKTEFINQINKFNHHLSDETIKPSDSLLSKETNTFSTTSKIEKRASFYETIWAQLITILLGLFIAAIIVFLIINPQYIKGTIIFRLSAILIPGFIYMYYRVFKNKSHEQTKENQ